MRPRLRTAVLISGRGSNMSALADAAQAPDYPAEIVLVISNVPKALGLDKARARGITSQCVNHREFTSRLDFDKALHEVLTRARIELICCAGFMRVLTPWFTGQWAGRMLNIHPSLLPKYKGLHTHQRALDNNDKIHGCTVHHVSAELDSGLIVAQEHIDILPDDTPDTLARRLLPIENALYVKALDRVAKDLRA